VAVEVGRIAARLGGPMASAQRGGRSAPEGARRRREKWHVGPREESPVWGWILSGFGVLLCFVGMALLILATKNKWGIVGTAGAFGMLTFGAMTIRHGKQAAMPSAEKLLRKDRRPPVLLLRSFHRDDTRVSVPRKTALDMFHSDYYRSRGGYTYEEELERVFSVVGPVITLGSPSDQARPLGAAREYVGDSEWRDRFRDLVGRARLIVVVLDDTRNLQWELGEVLAEPVRRRVVLLLPDFDEDPTKPNRRSETWTRNWSNVRKAFPFLPPLSTRTAAVEFDDSDEPVRINARSHSFADHCTAIDSLTAVQKYAELGRAWQELREFRTAAIGTAVFAGLLYPVFKTESAYWIFTWILALNAIGSVLVAVFLRRWPARCMTCFAAMITLLPIGVVIWYFSIPDDVGDAVGGGALMLLLFCGAGPSWLAFKAWTALPLARKTARMLEQQGRERSAPPGG